MKTMRKIKSISEFMLIASLFLITNSNASEIHFTYPGTRAMGMAGAFVAQADDSSAVLYNPAGLAQSTSAGMDITLEYGDMPVIDYDANAPLGTFSYDYENEKKIKFISWSTKNEKTGTAFGIAYFQPYQQIEFVDVSGIGNYTKAEGHYRQISFAAAKNFKISDGPFLNELSLGATLDMSNLLVEDKEEDIEESFMGTGYSLGVLIGLLKSDYISLSAGLNYRSKIDYSADYETTASLALEQTFAGRPEFKSYGIHARIPVKSWFEVGFNYDMQEIGWEDAYDEESLGEDFTKKAVGGEIIIPIPFGNHPTLTLRMGRSEGEADDKDFFDVNSSTQGVGLTWPLGKEGNVLSFDFAKEDREIVTNSAFTSSNGTSFESGDEVYGDNNITSFSMSYTF